MLKPSTSLYSRKEKKRKDKKRKEKKRNEKKSVKPQCF
jgi:hypothetical protein